MLKFYTFPVSGNTHRVELLLRALDVPFERIDVNLRDKEQKTGAFMAMNPFGQVPVIDDNGTVIWDSVAILTYVGLTYDMQRKWLPADPVALAQVMAWLAKTAGPIAFGLATARRINLFKQPADMDFAQGIAVDFLKVMEGELASRDWLVGEGATVADLAVYAYVAHAPEGGIDLVPFPGVCAWQSRVEALPFFVPMPKSKVGLWSEAAH